MNKFNLSLAVCAALTCYSSVLQAVQSPPNLVIFLADDLGYGDLGSYGHPIVKTPHIDELANDGILFTQYYAPSPLCSPSRAGLLTGRMPYRTGIRSWIPANKDVSLGRNELTIANLLKDKGYSTAIIGKLHLNAGIERKDQIQTEDMGFDYALVNPHGYVSNKRLETSPERPRHGKVYPDNFYRNGVPIGESKLLSGELLSHESLDWLKSRDKNKPFFLYVPFTEVHSPLASTQEYLDMYSNFMTDFQKNNPDLYDGDWSGQEYRGSGEYYANISYLDAQVGKIISSLKESGVYDNTIILFTSDNGPVTKDARKAHELNLAGETNGLRGRKDNLWEGGIRVPAIMKLPMQRSSSSKLTQPVTGLDLLPTLAEIMDFDVPTDRTIDGESIYPMIRGQSYVRNKPLIWGVDMPYQDNPVDEWAIRVGDWKMIIDREGKPKYLYDLSKDFFEINNLINKNLKIELDLFKAFLDYRYDIDNDSLMKERGETPKKVDW